MGKDLKGKELGKGLSQRPDGRYLGRAQVACKSIVLYSWNLKELKHSLALAIDQAKRNELMNSETYKSLTLNEWFEEWYSKYKAPILKNGGSASYKRKFTNYYGERIGQKVLSEIRQYHVQTAIADMLEAGRSSKSIRDATGILQNCIEAAMANGLIRMNPVLGVVIPKCEKVERRVLSVEEQKIFLDYLARVKSWYEEMYQIMLLTGMRIGEVGGLQWEDIDFVNKFIYVRRALSCQYEDGKKTMHLSSPKTENSVRKIPFFGETNAVLRRQHEKVTRRKRELGKRWRTSAEFGNLVFVTTMGSPVGRHCAERDLRCVTRQINEIARTESLYSGNIYQEMAPIHPHALRHTFATRCFEKGMTPRTVQEIMGHANYNTTVSYTHVLDEIKRKEAARVGNFLDNNHNRETIAYESLIGIM